ncbi:hypothetical protein GCM10009001_04720 [Virgibacillus siamensis]|uniref:exo-alpha-sialidase n=1 Tax=Virgibacillus siamensis TaxID=480071 RepID=A0ABP3QN67_9BACI
MIRRMLIVLLIICMMPIPQVLAYQDSHLTSQKNTLIEGINNKNRMTNKGLPPREDTYRSEDFKMFASISPDMLLNDSLAGDPDVMSKDGFGFRIPSLLRAVTPDKKDKDVLLSFSHIGNDSADWGNLDIAMRRSLDNGETWGNVNTIMGMPSNNAPQSFNDWGSAFFIDMATVQAENGDVVMMLDMYPESKGLHASSWLENGDGYKTVSGKDYMVLYSGDSKVGDGEITNQGETYTVRENGWIFDSNGRKTNYYIPQHHSAEYNYETMGDMYYATGEADYINETPPQIPEESSGQPEGSNDIYVGNIYLSYQKPEFNPENPVFVQKKKAGPNKEGKLYSKYPDVMTDPAPLRAVVTSYLWVTRSSDYGKTWSQPVNINSQVKLSSDGSFLGVGPGTGIVLKHQDDPSKNGRIVMPVYTLGKGSAVYSDDGGITWKRATSSSDGYINNIDEMQFIELADGTLMSFGRQRGKGPTPDME